jgi:hypothetical protein
MIAGMEVEIRQAALCVIRRDNTFLVAEIKDPHSSRREVLSGSLSLDGGRC